MAAAQIYSRAETHIRENSDRGKLMDAASTLGRTGPHIWETSLMGRNTGRDAGRVALVSQTLTPMKVITNMTRSMETAFFNGQVGTPTKENIVRMSVMASER